MIKTTAFKKTLTFLLALSMLFCCAGTFGNVQASAATDKVSMYYFEPYFRSYGAYVYIQTKDNASNQQVYVHYNDANTFGGWKDAEAEYITTLADGSKIWKAYTFSYDLEYAIKYVADGQTYWDNNNGNNYHKEILGTAPIKVNRRYSGDFNVTLQNYAYQKNVQIRYTEDNWKTYKDVPLSYQSTNSDGTENWSVDLKLDNNMTDEFHYCAYYQVNNQTYWENNLGENYDRNYYIMS